jgi:hypothetical protein
VPDKGAVRPGDRALRAGFVAASGLGPGNAGADVGGEKCGEPVDLGLGLPEVPLAGSLCSTGAMFDGRDVQPACRGVQCRAGPGEAADHQEVDFAGPRRLIAHPRLWGKGGPLRGQPVASAEGPERRSSNRKASARWYSTE